jgi:hypothetical protein
MTMTIARFITVLVLAGSGGLPYTAPALCMAFHPEMADSHAMMTHGTSFVAAQDSAGSNHCDFAECSTAPVAVADGQSITLALVPVGDVTLPSPITRTGLGTAPPLTHPPAV